VVEVRELLGDLARKRGVTVFMSSHILTEVDRLAGRIGIIHRGRLIEELTAQKLDGLRARRLEVQAREPPKALAALAASGFVVRALNGVLVLTDPRAIEAPDEIAALLVRAGTPPTRLAVEQEDLEEYFLRLTEGSK
jgi:ABC-2 type transport system ATP-binding protein